MKLSWPHHLSCFELSTHHGEPVGVDNERLAVVFGHDVEDDACCNQQQSRDNQHDRSDKRRETRHHASGPEFRGNHAAQHNADNAENTSKASEERQRFVLTNHTEDGAHHLNAVADSVELADGPFRTVAVLDRHLEQT